MPSNFHDPRLKISVTYNGIDINPTNDKSIHIYLADVAKPTSIVSIGGLENSSYYSSNIIHQEDFVTNDVTFELTSDYTQLWLIVGNPGTTTLDININVRISINNPTQTAVRIIALVISSILTLLFGIFAGYIWFEQFVGDWYKKRILTEKVTSRVNEFVATSETWEQILLILGTITLIAGLTNLFIGGSDTPVVFVGLVLFIVVYYNYNRRQKIQETIKRIITQHKNISLDQLSDIIQERDKNTKKAVLDLIFYEKFPMTYDFQEDMITYHPEKAADIIDQNASQPVQESQFAVDQSQVASARVSDQQIQTNKPMPVCAYCGEEALSHNAVFCHSCGASISSAK